MLTVEPPEVVADVIALMFAVPFAALPMVIAAAPVVAETAPPEPTIVTPKAVLLVTATAVVVEAVNVSPAVAAEVTFNAVKPVQAVVVVFTFPALIMLAISMFWTVTPVVAISPRDVTFSVSPVPAPPSIESSAVKVATTVVPSAAKVELAVKVSLPAAPTKPAPVSIPVVSSLSIQFKKSF